MKRILIVAMVSVVAQGCNTIRNANDVVVARGQPRQIGFYTSLNPDCSLIGDPDVRIAEPAHHGRVTLEKALDYPHFVQANQRYSCNLKKVPGVRVIYVPDPNYVGSDAVALDVIFASGNERRETIPLAVR